MQLGEVRTQITPIHLLVSTFEAREPRGWFTDLSGFGGLDRPSNAGFCEQSIAAADKCIVATPARQLAALRVSYIETGTNGPSTAPPYYAGFSQAQLRASGRADFQRSLPRSPLLSKREKNRRKEEISILTLSFLLFFEAPFVLTFEASKLRSLGPYLLQTFTPPPPPLPPSPLLPPPSDPSTSKASTASKPPSPKDNGMQPPLCRGSVQNFRSICATGHIQI